jgi:hypothetical protein
MKAARIWSVGRVTRWGRSGARAAGDIILRMVVKTLRTDWPLGGIRAAENRQTVGQVGPEAGSPSRSRFSKFAASGCQEQAVSSDVPCEGPHRGRRKARSE